MPRDRFNLSYQDRMFFRVFGIMGTFLALAGYYFRSRPMFNTAVKLMQLAVIYYTTPERRIHDVGHFATAAYAFTPPGSILREDLFDVITTACFILSFFEPRPGLFSDDPDRNNLSDYLKDYLDGQLNPPGPRR